MEYHFTRNFCQHQKKCKSGRNFPLHTWIHHGLSSQALLFNLVGKLIIDDHLDPLINLLNKAGISTPQNPFAEFEYDDRDVFNEKRQPTSIDLAIYEKDKKPCSGNADNIVFIENKFTEQGFGGCSSFLYSGNCSVANPNKYSDPDMKYYLTNLDLHYWKKMKEFEFDTTDFAAGDICPLANYYQFYREVLFALHFKGSFILLCDDRNPLFSTNNNYNIVWNLLQEAVTKKYKSKIARITIQDLVKEIEKSKFWKNKWINVFKGKYGIC